MKDYDSQDIKLLVRLRGNAEPKQEKASIEDSENKQIRKQAPKNTTQINTNQSKLADKKDAKKPTKNNTQQQAAKESDDDPKCTIFTSVHPSKTILCTSTPISKKLINSTFIREDDLYEYSYTFIKDSTLLEFDRVYSDAYKLENVYTEQIKECISNLFLGKNACIMQFGPAESGKTYTLRNQDPQDPGLINQAINDIFNLIEISKSTSKSPQQAKNVSTLFTARLAIYQVYNDCLNDLLSTQYSKNLNVERRYADEASNQNLIPDLSIRELKSKKDFELAVKEADNNRKNLSQSLKVNDLNKKSHLVTSLIIEKREKIPDGYNRTTEQALENFAQIDFVELADSNLGLASQVDQEAPDMESSKASEPVDDLLYRFISKTFNSVTNNILCASSGREVRNDTKLTLSLKNTLRANSQIILFTNAIPTEEPLVHSIKALKFTNWIRNQLSNQSGYQKPSNQSSKGKRTLETSYNRDSDDNEDDFTHNENKYRSCKQFEKPRYYKDHYSRERPERDENNERRDFNNPKYNFKYDKECSIEREEDNIKINHNNIQRRSNEIIRSNINYNNTYGDEIPDRYHSRLNEVDRKNYINSGIDRVDDFEDSRNRFNYRYQTIKNDDLNELAINDKENIHNYSNIADRIESRKETNLPHLRSESKNYLNNYDNSYVSNNQSKLVDVERTLRDLEAKSLEMSKHIENLRNERSRNEENRYPNNPNVNISTNNFRNSIDYEYEKLRQENSMLKSDNIIFREDINRLSDMNRHLEEEIRRQRDRNLELASENERLNQEKIQYKLDLEKANDSLCRSKIQEQTAVDQLNIRFVLENKIKDLENENRNIRDEKQRYEIDFKVLQERHLELKKNFDANENELNFIKHKQAEEVNNIEEKLDKMAKEIELLQRDNNSLRSNEERIRGELLNLEKQRDNYREKYQEAKSKNNILNTKLGEIEEEFKRLLQEKQNEFNEKRKEEETRKIKIDSKQKILEDMQNKILSYKAEILKNRNKKD